MLPVLIAAALALVFHTTVFLASHGLGRRWLQPFAAFTGALAAIGVAGLVSPSGKLRAGIGTCIVLWVVGSKVLERFDPITQQPTILPFAAGILGSALSLTILAIPAFLGRKHRARRGCPSVV